MDSTPSARFYVITILIVAMCISIFVAFARVIPCAWCHASWGIFPRAVGDLCRSCSRAYDHQLLRIGRRRSLLRRILRRAA